MWNDARTTNLIANTLAVLAVGAMFWRAWRGWRSVRTSRCQPSSWNRCRTASCTMSRRARCAAIAGRFKGNFFTVDLDDARSSSSRCPGAACHRAAHLAERAARAHRGTAAAGAVEREPDDQHLGEAFTANTGEVDDETVLPQFSGPEGTESLVVQRYAELARWFAPLDMHVKQLELSPRYAWRVVLSNGMLLDLGRDLPTRRIRTACRRAAVRGAHSTFCAGVARRGRTPEGHHHPGRSALSQWFRTGAGPVAAVGNQVQIHTETSQETLTP